MLKNREINASQPRKVAAARFASWHHSPWLAVLLFAVPLIAYLPVLRCGFIWDDDVFIIKNELLRNVQGLWEIFFNPGATTQYYPLTYGTMWVEYHLWGLQPSGYHLVNVVLHSLGVVLLWRVLLRLKLAGAWLPAAIFALHPVMVESVAWISERKNVLSGVLYFAAALAYLSFIETGAAKTPGKRRWLYYFGALMLFTGALLSKTVTSSLPAALLLVRWWKTGTLRTADVVPLLPFFALGVTLGLNTAHMEKHTVGAVGAEWALSFIERCLVAGRAFWFYLGKLFWPAELTFIYPRWNVSQAVWWQYLYPAAALLLLAVLWGLRRRMGRGPLVAVLFFTGTLFPALGFFDVYPFRYSFVADHFQYLASIGPLALAGVGIHLACRRLEKINRFVEPMVCGTLLLVLGQLTWRQCGMYVDVETLWTTTLERNPACWLAHSSLGNDFADRGKFEAAAAHFNVVVREGPEPWKALYNLGKLCSAHGKIEAAIEHYRAAIRMRPDDPASCNNLAWILATHTEARYRNGVEAVELAIRVVALTRNNMASGLDTLAAAYAEAGRFSEAMKTARQAMEMATTDGKSEFAAQIEARLKMYESARPYREQ